MVGACSAGSRQVLNWRTARATCTSLLYPRFARPQRHFSTVLNSPRASPGARSGLSQLRGVDSPAPAPHAGYRPLPPRSRPSRILIPRMFQRVGEGGARAAAASINEIGRDWLVTAGTCRLPRPLSMPETLLVARRRRCRSPLSADRACSCTAGRAPLELAALTLLSPSRRPPLLLPTPQSQQS